MVRKRWPALIGIGLVGTAAAVIGATATASGVPDWKGAEWMSVSAPAVNLAKCGAPAEGNYELHFRGSGIDTAGGTFTVEAAGCVNLETLRVTKLRAIDSFAGGGTIEIITDDFTLHRNAGACVVANRMPVKFTTGSGTGRLEGAKGSGHFHTAINVPGCKALGEDGAPGQPAYVWFEGELQLRD